MLSKISRRIWQIVYPILLYYVIYNVSYSICLLLFPKAWPSLLSLCVAAIITIPFMYKIYVALPFQKGEINKDRQQFIYDMLGVVGVVIVGLTINIIMTKTGIVDNSQGFEQSQKVLMSGGFWLQLICNGMIIPCLEELLYRGIVCGQLLVWTKSWIAILLSALCFGIFHFNIVQFIYAVLVGIALGILYEKRGKKLILPCVAHGIINIIVVIYSSLVSV